MPTPKTEQSVEDGEVPVRSYHGVVLANPAYHCRPRDLWPTELDELAQEFWPPLEEYLKRFARPVRTIADEVRCLACDLQVTGAHVHLQSWRHKSALTYSTEGTCEGRCNGCGYPVRLFHEIFTMDGSKLIVRLNGFPLFYHPDFCSRIN